MHINEKKTETENIEFYHPTYQDYKFWTEEKNLKKIFLEKPFSIKKYYSHNFFKYDNIGFFFSNEKDLFIPRYEKLMKENFNANMPKKMFFFKDPFFYREKIKYFDVKTPFSEIFYISDFLKKEKTLGGFFSQNFDEKSNYSVEYRNFHLENELDLKKSKDLLLTTFNYQNQNDYNYKLWGHYIYQKFDTKEKEEIPKWDIRNYKNVFFYHKKLIHTRFYISLLQKISYIKEKNRSLFLKTYMEYEKYSNDHSFIDFKGKKINHSYLRNGLFLIFNRKKISVEMGGIFDKIYYQLFNDSISKNKDINNLSIQTKIYYPINNVVEFYSNGKWVIENYNIKKSYLKGDIMLNAFLFSKFWLLTQLSLDENDNIIYNNFIPIHVLRKNQDSYNKNIFFFDREKTMNFSLSSYEKKYCVSFYISKLNHSFQDQDQEEEMKKFLYRKHIQLYGFKIKTTYDIWKFQLNNILLYQQYDADPLVFSIPNFLLRSTIFYKNNYFHKALFIQTGLSFHYFSKFYHQKASYPFNFQTFSLDEKYVPNKIIGGIPFVDYFFNFKIYRTIFYFGIQNINIGFYDVYNSHNNKLFIKTGFSWNLFT
ncbi:putative porin [Blattabacterium cuenoti]|uniref:putative porin n=1 Tax=Blattabacterium cuenoti TaxID=1653831 RepID=UPI001EEA4E81|nr:putative porin [Blattabacterium cuenoti]